MFGLEEIKAMNDKAQSDYDKREEKSQYLALEVAKRIREIEREFPNCAWELDLKNKQIQVFGNDSTGAARLIATYYLQI